MLSRVLEFSQASTFTSVVMPAWEKLVHGIFHQVSACSDCTLTTRHCDVTVYKKGGYLDVVNACANVSMLKAIDEVKALPSYSQGGEVNNFNALVFLTMVIHGIISTVGNNRCSPRLNSKCL